VPERSAAPSRRVSVRADATVVLLEFNELSPSLMTRFIEEGRLPRS
jgi:hypothetical protein